MMFLVRTDVSVDVHLDPWCMIEIVSGAQVLFGYALRHPTTGGLSWLVSTPVMWVDGRQARAVTASGRKYELGRRFGIDDLPSEGDEPWMAFDVLLRSIAADEESVPSISADPPADARWLAALKMARHLDLPAPGRAPRAVEAFVGRHLTSYLALRRAWGRA